MGVIRRLAYRLAQLFVVVFAITLAAVWVAERQALETYRLDRLEPVDVLIVLGGGVDPDRRLNWVGRTRANTAATALVAERAGAVIFSGTLNSDEHPEGEAGLMRNHALNRGVDPSKLFVETDSRTTLENLRFSFSLADAQGHERIAILTDAFHLPRALALAGLLGRDAVTGVAAQGVAQHDAFARTGYLLREAMAWWYNLAKAVAWVTLGALGFSESARGEWVV